VALSLKTLSTEGISNYEDAGVTTSELLRERG